MSFESVRLITFDCYGTLIDWESGMLAGIRPLLLRNGAPISDAKLLELYGDAEAEIESGPYRPYRAVLAETVQAVGRRAGVTITHRDGEQFANSLPLWEPFPDTVAGLKLLARRFRLGIISNIDDDLFAATRMKLGVEFDLVVTAQQVQSYKPSLKNFEEALRRSGLDKHQVLHAGQSVYHDIIPANSIGMASVWVNRPSARPGSGAAKAAAFRPEYEVESISQLVAFLSSYPSR